MNNPAIGRLIAKNTGDWVAMGWLLDATELDLAPDSALRMRRFAARNDPAADARKVQDWMLASSFSVRASSNLLTRRLDS